MYCDFKVLFSTKMSLLWVGCMDCQDSTYYCRALSKVRETKEDFIVLDMMKSAVFFVFVWFSLLFSIFFHLNCGCENNFPYVFFSGLCVIRIFTMHNILLKTPAAFTKMSLLWVGCMDCQDSTYYCRALSKVRETKEDFIVLDMMKSAVFFVFVWFSLLFSIFFHLNCGCENNFPYVFFFFFSGLCVIRIFTMHNILLKTPAAFTKMSLLWVGCMDCQDSTYYCSALSKVRETKEDFIVLDMMKSAVFFVFVWFSLLFSIFFHLNCGCENNFPYVFFFFWLVCYSYIYYAQYSSKDTGGFHKNVTVMGGVHGLSR